MSPRPLTHDKKFWRDEDFLCNNNCNLARRCEHRLLLRAAGVGHTAGINIAALCRPMHLLNLPDYQVLFCPACLVTIAWQYADSANGQYRLLTTCLTLLGPW